MTEAFDSSFFAELLDDYYAECDEHIAAVQRALLEMESLEGQPIVDKETLNDLLRAFHTMKGLSGMVGFSDAEKLAHQTETYLKLLSKGETVLSSQGVDALMAAAKGMEQIILAHRSCSPPPDVSSVAAMLEDLTRKSSAPQRPESRPTAPSPLTQAPTEESSESKQRADKDNGGTWRITFRPNAELAARGVNVSQIRSRLLEIGKILQASPQVSPDGGITFEFVVSTEAEPSIFEAWRDDGITWELISDSKPGRPPKEEKKAPQAAPSPAPQPLPVPSSNVVRVDLSRLDELMRTLGDLVVQRARLEENLKAVEPLIPTALWRPLQETSQALSRQLRDLREGIMRVRMVPMREAFERMRFAAHDLARNLRKKVRVEIEGEETEIDKLIVDRILDPLLHMVRNAVSHGLEASSERLRRGKPEEGKIILRALTEGDAVLIQIADDGRGIDQAKVARRAEEMGLTATDASVDEATLLDVICESGFSTRDQADLTSGRGVGMAVVAETVRELGGTISLESELGKGTRFTLRLPLTLAITDALIVGVGGYSFAIPIQCVREVMQIRKDEVTFAGTCEMVPYRNGILPLIHVSKRFGLQENNSSKAFVLVVGSGDRPAGIVVERLLGRQEIVVHALTDELLQVRGFAGATELGDGRIVLILDTNALTDSSISSKMKIPAPGKTVKNQKNLQMKT